MEEIKQFNGGQQVDALALLEQLPWGDMHYAIVDMEECLRRALEATRDEFQQWENDLAPELETDGYDEFTLPDELIEDMPPEQKLAYVARLLRSLALAYGVSADYPSASSALVGDEKSSSPAGLLRGINDITWMPTQD
jgi:hypothetical protein